MTLQARTILKKPPVPSLPWKSYWSLMERLWNSLKATTVLPLLKLSWKKTQTTKQTTKQHLLYRWLHRGMRRLRMRLLRAFPNLKLLVIKRDIFSKGNSSARGKPNAAGCPTEAYQSKGWQESPLPKLQTPHSPKGQQQKDMGYFEMSDVFRTK